MQLVVFERTSRERWVFNFIYYNNKFFGGTRNEFRLTCMTQYLRSVDARTGDTLVFSRDEDASFVIECSRANRQIANDDSPNKLVLSGGWTVIKSK